MTHPRWKTLRDKLTKGCEYPVDDLIIEVIIVDLKENLERGKHKSPKRNEHFLGKSMKKEVENGWGILLPEDDAASIPGLEIAPMGVAEHLGINAFGEYIPKMRVTHDLSFPGIKSKESLKLGESLWDILVLETEKGHHTLYPRRIKASHICPL